jgi:hypothetical protein
MSGTLPDLKPMPTTCGWSRVGDAAVNVEIADPRHFMRTMAFAYQNELHDEFSKAFTRLLHLLAQEGGVIWPDAQNAPSFSWRGCGMVGGFIFHERSREWLIHT